MNNSDEEYIKKLEWHIDSLIAQLQRVENEAVALATENSNLRSELHALREAIKYG